LYVERDLIAQVEDSETDYLVTLDVPALSDKAAGLMHKSRLKSVIICPAGEDLRAPTIVPEQDGVIPFAALLQSGAKPAAVDIDADQDIAVLQYTGGTTGVPKGAMLTHKNLYANALQMSHWYHSAAEGQDSMIVVLPLFHVFAMTVAMNMPLMKGMQLLLQPAFGVAEVLGLIRDHKPAYIAGVPTMYIALANDSRVAEHDFSCFKFCLSGGAPLPADVKRIFEERTKARLVAEGYGLTEFSPVATCNPHSKKARAGSIGLPIPGTVVEIVSLEDGVTPLPHKEKGEVVVTGAQMMKGYYKRDLETAQVIKNGRLHTGDVGYMDADGFVYLVDRVKDLVLVGGYNVYPRHVEEVIYTHPAVEECIVAGVPDKLRGEAVQAWIKLRTGESVSAETLKTFLKDKLSPTEMPKKIIIRDLPLPKTAVGKLSKKDLLEEEGIQRN
ncbi:MAG: AMP-binding protein, partial [Bdellovibrionales bacterium]|nr:AMP-binding protein [Bdellovibrionales bacterium]